ncbi:MAG: hypothetical protein OEW06_01025 [Gemmatimonadota bacterium]|nr:hypothetical protein [Gemmatimonadota bacterium]MDH4350127.1 hypothetical protein [Gemmatimonadota bacterium]
MRHQPRRWVAVACAATAVLGGLWSVIPVSVWWAGTDPAVLVGAWQTWAWGAAVVVGVTVVLMIASRGRAPVWLLGLWRRSVGRSSTATILVIASGLLVTFAILVFTLVFALNPRSVDGFVQLFHARIFLAGRLWVEPPAELANFATLHMVLGPDRWFSQYPPGQPAVMAMGLLLGSWWLLQPVFGVLLVLVTYRVARWVTDETTARVTIMLLALCPFVVAVTASELSHLPAATLGVAAAAAATMLGRPRWPGWALLAGAALGTMVAFRPLDAVAAAIPVGVVALLAARRRVGALGLIAVGGLLATLPTLWFNARTTGSWSEFGYALVWGRGIALGFHDVPWGIPLTPLRAVGLTGLDLHQINMYLLDLPVPVLLVVAVGFLVGVRQIRGRDGVPLIAVGSLIGLLFFYFHRDTFYGPRLLFSVVPWLLVILARAIVLLRRSGPMTRAGAPRGMVLVTGLVIALALGLSAIAPSRLAAYRASTPMLNYHPEREAAGLDHAVVLIPDGWGTRLVARMWEAGVPMRRSGRLYGAIDACTLERTLDQADADSTARAALVATLETLARLGRPGLRANRTEDRALRLPSAGPLPADCEAEIAFDQRGFLAFAPYLYLNTAGLDGRVVWARDLRDRNGALRRRYPDRQFYRYAPERPGGPPRLEALPDAAPTAAGR